MSTIHGKIRPCDVRGFRAGNERHHRGNLIYVPIAVERPLAAFCGTAHSPEAGFKSVSIGPGLHIVKP